LKRSALKKIKPYQVRLVFYPEEFENVEEWNKELAKAKELAKLI
jgi:hypothetical protein